MLSIEMVHGDKCLWAYEEGGVWKLAEHEVNHVTMARIAHQFYAEGMHEPHRFTLVLEDTIIVRLLEFGHGNVIAFDMMTGTYHNTDLDDDQVCALLQLAIGGDEVPRAEEYYELLAKPLWNWPKECRPVP